MGLPFGIDTDLSNLDDVRDAEEYLQTLSVDDMRRMVGDLPPLTDEEVLRQAREANRQFREKMKAAGMWKNPEPAAPAPKARRRSG